MSKLTFFQVKDNWWYRVLQVSCVLWFLVIFSVFVYGVCYGYYLSKKELITYTPAVTSEEQYALDAVQSYVSRDDMAYAFIDRSKQQQVPETEISEQLDKVLTAYDKYRWEQIEVNWSLREKSEASQYIFIGITVFIGGVVLWYILRLVFLYVLTGKLIWWRV